MPPGITGAMAIGEPSQTIGAQSSLGRSVTYVQFLLAQLGAAKLVLLTDPLRAKDRRRLRRQKSGQTGSA